MLLTAISSSIPASLASNCSLAIVFSSTLFNSVAKFVNPKLGTNFLPPSTKYSMNSLLKSPQDSGGGSRDRAKKTRLPLIWARAMLIRFLLSVIDFVISSTSSSHVYGSVSSLSFGSFSLWSGSSGSELLSPIARKRGPSK